MAKTQLSLLGSIALTLATGVMNSAYIMEARVNLKDKLLDTEYPKWKNTLSMVVLALSVICSVGAFTYLSFIGLNLSCWSGFLYMSYLWAFFQLPVIFYLYTSSDIPSYARQSVSISLLFANAWFILAVFSLKPCG